MTPDDVTDVLAGAVDAAGTPVPAEFEAWVAEQIAPRAEQIAKTIPTPPNTVVEFDLDEILRGE